MKESVGGNGPVCGELTEEVIGALWMMWVSGQVADMHILSLFSVSCLRGFKSVLSDFNWTLLLFNKPVI